MRSNLRALVAVTAVCALVLSAGPAAAQLPVPQLNSIFPCGARQGDTVECEVRGSDLTGATGLYFSHSGITARPAGTNKYKVTVARNVPVGLYDVRVSTPQGISSFRTFVVGDWPEAVEKEPNDEPTKAQRVTLPVVVNGRIDRQTDLDHYVFAAKKGQRVLINCWAWRLDSQLDSTLMVYDAKGKELAYNGDYYGKDSLIDFTAPDDGDYIVKVWDFVYSGSPEHFYRLHIGSLPHIDAAIPAAIAPGKKTTVTFYGRNLPGGKPAPGGEKINGQPLEIVTRAIEGPTEAKATSLRIGEAVRPSRASLDGMDYRLTTPEGSSNPIFLAFTSDPIILEKEPNNDLKTAQRVPIPCDVTGTFAPTNDVDYYTFTAKKGEKIIVEVFGERQSGTVDPFLTGFDPKGKRMVALDDGGRNIGQIRFTTQTRDPLWELTAPADGDYSVCVRDLYHQQRGGPHFTYRLSIRRPRPDFRLVAVPQHDVVPDATVIGRGGKERMDVLVFRQDGFNGPIEIKAAGLPTGVSCAPVVIGPGKTSAPLVFQAAREAAIGHGEIRVTGTARLGEADVTREARGGGLTWRTTNTPGIARLADSIVLSVRESSPFTLTAEPAQITLMAGSKLTLKIKLQRASDWTGAVQLSGFDLPTGATVALSTVANNAAEGKVELTLPAKMPPDPYTFTINGAGQAPREYAMPAGDKKGAPKGKGANVRAVYPSNPITITVTEPTK